jgi:hypothetical protein
MASEANWYCVSQDGVATLFVDKDDAEANAKVANRLFPGYAPYRAVQLVDAAELDALKARIAELEAELESVGAGGVQPMRGLPDGWVPCVVTYEGQQPEEVAYGPQRLMDRLKKWLDRYFAMRAEQAALTPVEHVGWHYKYLNLLGQEEWSFEFPSSGKVLETVPVYVYAQPRQTPVEKS